jgi:16S rRNA (cytosine967-C5)-methyltransferase
VSSISPARKSAFDILLAVERGQGHSDELLRGSVVNALTAADRNLATALVLGVLRWQILLDHEIRPLLKRPNARLDPEVLIALRLGAFQLRFLDRIPAHAAIDESVEIAKQAGHRFASGMVNAVLRHLARATPKDAVPGKSPAEVALAFAHPAWMVERWVGFYGLDAARAICAHGQTQPRLSVRLHAPDVEAELAQDDIHLEPAALLRAARIVISGDLTATEALRAGRVRIQDEGSQLIGELAASAIKNLNQNQKKIVDLCAAPGGKTLILAERNSGAHIVACEANTKRFEQLRERLAPLSSQVECRLTDAAALQEDFVFDLALADVPCSGTGTLGRNPEIRHRLRSEDFARQAERQRAILHAAIRAVRPGGRVVYSTCSLEPEENEQVIDAVLAQIPKARQVSLADRIDSLLDDGILTAFGAEILHDGITPTGALRLLPGAVPTDGFFVAMLEKAAD